MVRSQFVQGSETTKNVVKGIANTKTNSLTAKYGVEFYKVSIMSELLTVYKGGSLTDEKCTKLTIIPDSDKVIPLGVNRPPLEDGLYKLGERKRNKRRNKHRNKKNNNNNGGSLKMVSQNVGVMVEFGQGDRKRVQEN
ncbi:hypothetical protein QJS10_CPA03g02519 [Acorus calamus]|uniref:Uncharacterized protein n=1 Tax=Acorus calamus TaxID=4465 RepID=A0AAV9FAH4_ACOCL|nr:hypothetical protein QJS10_CPA03g02519 [Acorus calamus]